MKHLLSALCASLLFACTAAPSPGPTLRALYRLPATQTLSPKRTALLLVDFQEEFFHGKLPMPEGPRAAARAHDLLAWARRSNVMVVHVRNVAKPGAAVFAPDSPTLAFVPEVTPAEGELVVTKPTGGAFTKTDLDATLRAHGVDSVVVAGIMTHLAVAMTAQDAAVLGYHVLVAADATTTRDLPGAVDREPVSRDALARAALAAIADRFGEVLLTREVTALPLVP
jgi:nicotinamidase-related amidase